MRSKDVTTELENKGMPEQVSGPLRVAWRMYPILLVTILPVALTSNLWLEVWHGARSRATDGSGHWGMALIYAQSIFPDTFGWTHAYFGGMPFPNFYPPLFHWCVGLMSASHLVTFATAFKLMLSIPLMLLPASIWVLAWRVSGRDRTAATAAAFACVLLMTDSRFHLLTCGLDYSSTFNAGFYTQPLGFVLLLAWYVVYLDAHRGRRRSALACVLLALTILANFFNAFTGALFVVATLACDLLKLKRAEGAGARREAMRALTTHFVTPLVALGLALFWLVPMSGAYDFFVTRPLIVPLGGMMTRPLWGWYVAAALGCLLWLREPASATRRAYLLSLSALALLVVLAPALAPRTFPLQAFRFFSTLNFLLTVPIGRLLAALADGLKIQFKTPLNSRAILRHLCVVGGALLFIGATRATGPSSGSAFYSKQDDARIEAVLRFAREHRTGRYLVEVLDNGTEPLLQPDGPALNAYLGAQGNETLSVVYREASPNSLFFNAQANALSDGTDSFGISSVLADDLDFASQPLSQQLARARFLGVRYLVIATKEMKASLSLQPDIGARYDFDGWSVFELRGDVMPQVTGLQSRPALVVSDFSVKGRGRDEYDFTRLAEEQFNDAWFDVLLARSPLTKIDRLQNLDDFGALVLDKYDCDDETLAFQKVQDYAARRPLILLSSDAPLFRRLRDSLAALPLVLIIERPTGTGPGASVEALAPSAHYNSNPVRATWREIRRHLEAHKVAINVSMFAPGGAIEQNRIRVWTGASTSLTERVPVLIRTSYFPNWRRTDGEEIYAATPFYILTFISEPAQLVYERRPADRLGLWASAILLCALCGFTLWPRRSGLKSAS
ncbi:MAG: hypothetical protein WCD76_16570 [Pyrinomonadaceae bacterium]